MGGCLDLPSPPPKEYRDAAASYKNGGVKYRPQSGAVSLRSRSSSVGSAGRMTGMYSAYQPYAPMYPPQPLVILDPNTGQTFPYHPPPMPMGPPQPFPIQLWSADGHYDYYGYDEYDVERRTRRSHHHKRKENGIDKNANRRSTVIATFPDPSDDVIIQGDEALPSRLSTGVVATDVLRTTAGGQTVQHTSSIVTTAETSATSTSQTAQLRTQNGQITEVSGQSASSRPGRGSTYITYIKDVPLPPPEVVEEVETVQRETVTTTQTDRIETADLVTASGTGVVEDISEDNMFVETSGPIADIDKLLVDEEETVTKTENVISTTDISRSVLRQVSLARRSTSSVCDVVIAGVPEDLELIRRLARMIEGSGMSVLVSLGDPNRSEEESSRTGQAVIDSKVLVVVLSLTSAQSPIVRDEVSLARISDSVIFPVALDETLDILDNIDITLKLQVAGYQWTELRDRDHPSDIVLDLFVNSLREEVDFIKTNPDIIDEDYGEVSNRAERRHNLMRRRQMLRMISSSGSMTAAQFWNKLYPELSEVDWSRFRRDFSQEFRGHLDNTLPRPGQLHAMEAFKRELVTAEEGDVVSKAQFVVFCNDDGQDEDLWEKYIALARENLAIRDVFDVESSVRLVAIQNIGRFGSPSVMSALRDLLSDSDANIRAVAAVSLSRCISPSDERSFRLLLLTLDDEDRLVREAGCLAMGHLQATQAVSKLAEMWRNDVISHVREAASAALEEIGGEEAEDSMRVTRILADEIRALT